MQQISKLRKGIEMVCACPGRLLDHISRGTIDVSTIEALVLDEADQMFDMGFLPDIKKIIKQLPADRQTLLFSATMPEAIRGLANKILRDPVKVQVGHTAPAATVSHTFYPVESHLKKSFLETIIDTTKTGDAFTFVTGADKGPTHSIRKILGKKLKICKLKGFDVVADPGDNSSYPGYNAGQKDAAGRSSQAKRGWRPRSKRRLSRRPQRQAMAG